MALYSEAPPARPFSDDKPTLIVMWWITIFCTAIILTRLAGRYIRVEKLFGEDKIAALALVPLYLRAFCVHFVLRYGTNNVQLDGLTDDQLKRRVIGSKLVLASRIFYAATLWTLKFTTMEFFGRLAGATRKKSHATMIVIMRWLLVGTFIAVIVSDLAECQPFTNYWRVTPDPGGKCRQGFVQLITTASCNVATDLLLIAFPIPIILQSKIALKRKLLLVMLFSLALVIVIITLCRVPKIINSHGSQLTRSMWASVELLAAVAVGNTVALGSFLRDSGVKRRKFKPGSSGMSASGISGSQPTRVTRTTASNWEEESDDAHSKISGEGIWASGASQDVEDSAGGRRQSKSSGGRGISPTQSHDSLITRDQLSASLKEQARYDDPPARAVAASSKGLHRGSTVRLGGMD